ncbi:MAG: right-handed parallel beta-helix repeat-containing protein, partial [Candidatus ainarchaeum sp.]|nr:right-handed parallel beta-helix repeat-containing protein [Candidatus ainarchaeum sp.]
MLQNAIRVRWLGIAALMLLCSLSFAFTCTAPSGTCRYVATTGTDSGNCSDNSTPCLTINYTLGQANANDTVYVFAGTYNENAIINKSGIFLQGSGAGSTILTSTSGYTILVNSAHAVVSDMTVLSNGTGIYLGNASSYNNNTVKNCFISGSPASTAITAGTSSVNTIMNNTITNVSVAMNLGTTGTHYVYGNLVYNVTYAGIRLSGATIYIENNTMTKMSGNILRFDTLPGPTRVKNNIFSGTSISNTPSSVTSTYNLFSGMVNQGVSNGTGDIYASSMFVDYDTNDYRLACGSPAINSSSTGTYNRGWYQGPCVDVYAGPIWYVSMTGNDSTGDGSPANPFRTVQKAANKSNPGGDTILVGAGTYNENVIISKSGISLQGSGAGNTILTSTSGYTILVDSAHDIVSDMTVLSNGTGIYLGFTATYNNNTVKNCFISGSPASTAITAGNSVINTITNNTIMNVSTAMNLETSTGTQYVYGNLIYNVSYAGIRLYGATAYIENNTLAKMGGNIIRFSGVPVPTMVKNNIFSGTSISTSPSRITSTYNLFSGLVNQGVSNGTGDIYGSPVFADYDTNDYRLACGSPAINSSSTGTYNRGWYQGPCVDVYAGPIWYVSMTGNDSTGDGSPANPFRTVQKAANKSNPGGDTILVGAGTYNENVIISKLMVSLQGSGAGNTILTSTSGYTILVDSGYDTVSDMTVLSNGTGIYLGNAANYNNNTVKNCFISGSPASTAITAGNSFINTIMNNTITNVTTALNLATSTGTHYVYGNLIYNVSSTGISLFGATAYIENNTLAKMGGYIMRFDGLPVSTRVKNNIFSGTSISNTPSRITSTYNLFFGMVNQGVSNGTGDMYTSPVFFDYNGNDYRLACGSPAYMTGSNNATSMGWYQGLEVPA